MKFWQEIVAIIIAAAALTYLVSVSKAAAPPLSPYETYAAELETTYNLSPGLLRAIFKVESNWNPKAVGAAGEIGLGQIKPSTLLKICAACAYKQAYLSLGSVGSQVVKLQNALGVAPDGVFGPVTHATLMQYQQNKNLTVDGVVGPSTWLILFGSRMPVGDLTAELFDPYKNMQWTALYVVWLRTKLGVDDPTLLIAAYNGGDANGMVQHLVKWKKAQVRYASI